MFEIFKILTLEDSCNDWNDNWFWSDLKLCGHLVWSRKNISVLNGFLNSNVSLKKTDLLFLYNFYLSTYDFWCREKFKDKKLAKNKKRVLFMFKKDKKE